MAKLNPAHSLSPLAVPKISQAWHNINVIFLSNVKPNLVGNSDLCGLMHMMLLYSEVNCAEFLLL